jgi:hypothetical protein
MDQSGESLTQAGRILGIVATILQICFFSAVCLIMMVAAANGRR